MGFLPIFYFKGDHVMKMIQKLSDYIEDEIKDAEKYARNALEYKEKDSALADMYYKLANDEMGHMNTLHTHVTRIIDDYKKKSGDPPEAMLLLYDILHKKHIENAAYVKALLGLYKP